MFKQIARGVAVLTFLSIGTANAADKPIIGVSLADDTNPFYIGIRRGIDARAKQIGVDVVYVTANDVAAQQINGIQDLIARKVDALLVSPVDTVAVAGAYQMASQAGIPVISMVRFANSPYEKRVVTMDWKSIGSDIGEWVAGKIQDKGKVAMIDGPAGAQLFRDLAIGFKSAISKHPGISIIFEKDVSMTRESGLKQAEDALAATPDLAAIYGANDEVALGAAQAVAAAGKTGQIIITGLNGVPPAIKAVKDGSISLTYDLDGPGWGAIGLNTAAAYARGKTPSDDEVAVHAKRVDRTNVEEFLAPH
jgi:ribose transport system substrate-binding protein